MNFVPLPKSQSLGTNCEIGKNLWTVIRHLFDPWFKCALCLGAVLSLISLENLAKMLRLAISLLFFCAIKAVEGRTDPEINMNVVSFDASLILIYVKFGNVIGLCNVGPLHAIVWLFKLMLNLHNQNGKRAEKMFTFRYNLKKNGVIVVYISNNIWHLHSLSVDDTL